MAAFPHSSLLSRTLAATLAVLLVFVAICTTFENNRDLQAGFVARTAMMPSTLVPSPHQLTRRGFSPKRGANLRGCGSLGFLNIDSGVESLLSDLREGETIDNKELAQPANWDQYKAFVAETGGPTLEDEGVSDIMVTAPVDTSYGLNVLWLEKNIAIAVDEIYPGNKRIPLTTFHLWPQTDAWEDIKGILESKSWIAERDIINVLNQATEIINFWQEQHSTEDARENFKDVVIRGTEQAEGSIMEVDAVDSLLSADNEENTKDFSAIPKISLKQAAGFEDLMAGQTWYRDPEVEGPWDADSGVWKDVSIKTVEQLQASVPQKMPGAK
eukprot:CAMPEP_0184488210 /NCGR_PEP_ID=MMETSP0113_2-20130426/10594_1 /TAXON_ID=91329 /ORGANISM="Norrisiella sphaerica, Strain BC52" /LENGTH=327 /DNA_ID=CAMNT_0026870713 /DNA_START=17 /DNA_END=1000 /DNA_ORIENTATION=+